MIIAMMAINMIDYDSEEIWSSAWILRHVGASSSASEASTSIGLAPPPAHARQELLQDDRLQKVIDKDKLKTKSDYRRWYFTFGVQRLDDHHWCAGHWCHQWKGDVELEKTEGTRWQERRVLQMEDRRKEQGATLLLLWQQLLKTNMKSSYMADVDILCFYHV